MGDKYRYVVTVKQDCCIRFREATRVIELDHLDPAKAIREGLKQVMADTDYNFWQSAEVSVKCERTA